MAADEATLTIKIEETPTADIPQKLQPPPAATSQLVKPPSALLSSPVGQPASSTGNTAFFQAPPIPITPTQPAGSLLAPVSQPSTSAAMPPAQINPTSPVNQTAIQPLPAHWGHPPPDPLLPKPNSVMPTPPMDYLKIAQDQMRKEQKKQYDESMVDAQRRQIDPAYAEKNAKDEKVKEREKPEHGSPTAGQTKMGFAAFAASNLGMPQVAGMLSATAGFGPLGAIIAGVKIAIDTLDKGLQHTFKLSAAVGSLDPIALGRGFSDLLKEIPLLGGVIGTVTGGILDLGEAVTASARKLSGYSPALAVGMAQLDIQQIYRDINRAQKFGPDLLRGAQAKQEFDNRLNDLIDKYLPTIIKFLTSGLDKMEGALNILEVLANVAGTIYGAVDKVVPPLLLLSPATFFLGKILDAAKDIKENTTPPAGVEFADQLLNMQSGFSAAPTLPGPSMTPAPGFGA